MNLTAAGASAGYRHRLPKNIMDEIKGKCVQGNCESGHGVYEFSNGARYEGNWINGKLHGKGVSVDANGGRYEGDWKEGKRHGKGTLRFPEGIKYEGNWKDDKEHGYGTLFLHWRLGSGPANLLNIIV